METAINRRYSYSPMALDERLYSMIARLKRELFGKNTNNHWLVVAESL